MSKSYNEKTIPIMRGRKNVLKSKRLSSKRVRRMQLETNSRVLRLLRKTIEIDR